MSELVRIAELVAYDMVNGITYIGVPYGPTHDTRIFLKDYIQVQTPVTSDIPPRWANSVIKLNSGKFSREIQQNPHSALAEVYMMAKEKKCIVEGPKTLLMDSIVAQQAIKLKEKQTSAVTQ